MQSESLPVTSGAFRAVRRWLALPVVAVLCLVPRAASAQLICEPFTLATGTCGSVSACCDATCWYDADGTQFPCDGADCEQAAQELVAYCNPGTVPDSMSGGAGSGSTTPAEVPVTPTESVRNYKDVPLELCSNTCRDPADGYCDDGREGSNTSICELGTDCTDCGTYVASGGCSIGMSPVNRTGSASLPFLALGLCFALRRAARGAAA